MGVEGAAGCLNVSVDTWDTLLHAQDTRLDVELTCGVFLIYDDWGGRTLLRQ